MDLQVSASGRQAVGEVSGMTSREGGQKEFPRKTPLLHSQDAHQGAQRTISFCCRFLSDLNMVFLKVSSASAGSELGMLIRQVSNEMFHTQHTNNSTIHITPSGHFMS